jgi:hypothetical protein
MLRGEVWDELQSRGAALATVPFSGRAGSGGRIGTITLTHAGDGDSVELVRSGYADKFAYALAAPVWDRFGAFAGQPSLSGVVRWSVDERTVVIAGRRGGETFREVVP